MNALTRRRFTQAALALPAAGWLPRAFAQSQGSPGTVSYTHLTLPTKA